jgi:MacB-like periplasmic core domain
MTLRPAPLFHLLCLGVLRCASLGVPRRQRPEWWREWRAELWHVRQACTPNRGISWRAEREVAAFCLGAFQDARCFRQQLGQIRPPRAVIRGSATQCILLFAGLIAVSLSVAVLLPGVREQLYQFRYRIAPNIVLIQSARSSEDSAPTISAEQFRLWRERRQHLFSGFAFYQVVREAAPNPSNAQATLSVAHASTNLFQLLKLPIQFAAADAKVQANLPSLVLSNALWKKEFGGNPRIAGQTVRFGQHTAVVAGVVPAGSWRLPGKVDAWLLESDSALPVDRDGIVLAEMTKSSERERFGGQWHMSAPTPDGTPDDFTCLSLAERTHNSAGIFLFAIILACLALPATTSLPLGEYRLGSRKLSWSTRLRRWSFLVGKFALLLPIVYLVSIDLAHLRPAFEQDTSDYIQLISAFSICVFGLRWILRDQRRRCPVCLRKLTHPARVGQPSRNFLAWNGIELICIGGHGLLHVPEIPTSWFSTQRWLYLDPSWDILFAQTGFAPAYF